MELMTSVEMAQQWGISSRRVAILCEDGRVEGAFKKGKYESVAQKKQNKERLIEYSREKLFPGKSDEDIEKMLGEYAAAIEDIRTDYRNPSAHTDQLHQIDAEQCFNLVLDVEKLLKKMLDSFYK